MADRRSDGLGWGSWVRVVRGRKVPIGTVGEIFWHGPNTFQPVYRNGYNHDDPFYRVGIRLPDDTRVFTAGSNVEPIPAPALTGAASVAA